MIFNYSTTFHINHLSGYLSYNIIHLSRTNARRIWCEQKPRQIKILINMIKSSAGSSPMMLACRMPLYLLGQAVDDATTISHMSHEQSSHTSTDKVCPNSFGIMISLMTWWDISSQKRPRQMRKNEEFRFQFLENSSFGGNAVPYIVAKLIFVSFRRFRIFASIWKSAN